MRGLFRLILLFCLAGLLSASQAQYFSAQKNYKAALSAFKERNYYSARLLFQEIVHKDPLGEYGDDAQYYLALTYFYEGEYKSSIFELKILTRDYPTSKFALRAEYWTGENYFFLKDYNAALETHHIFVRKHPNHKRAPYSLYTTGFIYMEQKRYDEAIAEFNRALEKYPDSPIAPDISLQVGIAFYNTREYFDARKHFRNLILRYGKSNIVDEAQFWIGKTYFEQKKFAEAEKEFGFVLTKFPREKLAPEALYFIALCRYKQKDTDSSLTRLKQILAEYPGFEKTDQVHFRMGQVYAETGQNANAVKSFNVVLDQHPKSTYYLPSLEMVGSILQKQGKGQLAIAIYDKLLANPKTGSDVKPVILSKKAGILFLDKKYAEADQVYKRLYEQYPARKDAPEAIYMHAQSLVNQGLASKALERLDVIIKKYPDSKYKVDAYFLKAEIYFSLGNYTRALQFYRKITRFYPKHHRNYDAMMGIGWSYFELKQFSRASDQFKAVLKQYKKPEQRVETYRALASCRYNLRDFKGAIRLYRLVQKKYSQFAGQVEEATFQIAWVYQRQKNFKKSQAQLALYIEKYPRGKRIVEAYYFQGWALYYQNQYGASEKSFAAAYQRAEKENLFKEKALLDMAKAQRAGGRFGAATESLEKYITENKDSKQIEEAHYNLAEAYLLQNKPDQVMSVYNRLKQVSPKSAYLAEILRGLGDYYRDKGDNTRAEQIYMQIIENSTSTDERVEAEFSRINLYIQSGRRDKAISLMVGIIENKNEEYIPYKNRALVQYLELLFKNNAYQQALQVINKYLPQFKSDEIAYNELQIWRARTYIKLKKYKTASTITGRLMNDRNVGLLARFYAALSYFYRGDLLRSYDYFKQVLQKSEDTLAPKSLYYMGEINLKRRKYKRAIRDYSKIVYLYSSHNDLYEKALYKTAFCFKKSKKNKEYQSYLAKLKEAFPQSKYIKKLE